MFGGGGRRFVRVGFVSTSSRADETYFHLSNKAIDSFGTRGVTFFLVFSFFCLHMDMSSSSSSSSFTFRKLGDLGCDMDCSYLL